MKYYILLICLFLCSCGEGLTSSTTYEIGETVYIREYKMNGTLREIKDGSMGSIVVLLDVDYIDETGKMGKKIIKTYLSRIEKIKKEEPKKLEIENGK